MSRNEYTANKDLTNSAEANKDVTKAVKYAPVGYVTGPVIRLESEKPVVKQGDVNDSSTWGIV